MWTPYSPPPGLSISAYIVCFKDAAPFLPVTERDKPAAVPVLKNGSPANPNQEDSKPVRPGKKQDHVDPEGLKSRSKSVMPVFERVRSSTFLTITAQ